MVKGMNYKNLIRAYGGAFKAMVKFTMRSFTAPPHECPICGFKGRFVPVGEHLLQEARCPSCLSWHRHRLIWLWIIHNRDMIKGKRVLHFAPESCLRHPVSELAGVYIGSDLAPVNAQDKAIDIENINLPENSVDVVICSHVLEHVRDDKRALSEIYRVIAPKGVALIMVPVIDGLANTYEDFNITADIDRTRHFGQHDHVRIYGYDLRNRIKNAGFKLEEYTKVGEDAIKFALQPGENVFICHKGEI
jgi:hypothetical protein